ncbi:MAG TPA: hypothetical protein ENJ06_01515 [Phycisphaeraceae bacterium]|nr:hypothetical protein [Phycisphaeraceae bacterium]
MINIKRNVLLGGLSAVLLATGVSAQNFMPADPVPKAYDSRILTYNVDEERSEVSFTLLTGSHESQVDGWISFRAVSTDDPAQVGRVRLIVHRAWLIADDFADPNVSPFDRPLIMTLSPMVISSGWWNPYTGNVNFELYLTTPTGPLPVPMPLNMEGIMTRDVLVVQGDNGNVPDGGMALTIAADRQEFHREALFSTEIGFSAIIGDPVFLISDGDLLGVRRCLHKRNGDLTENLGFMPPVPDLGLDAVTLADHDPVLFSLEEGMFSETLGWVGDGDLLSDSGHIVRTNAQLIHAFQPETPGDVGLDAVHADTFADSARGFLFSVERDFISALYDCPIRHGYLLAENGDIVATNHDLLAHFHPPYDIDPDHDFGLDAVFIRRNGEIWFSVEEDFMDAQLGLIRDGDLLSNRGYVVARNLQLLHGCSPLEDLDNFGLDAFDMGTFGADVDSLMP